MDAVVIIGIALAFTVKGMFFSKPEVSSADIIPEDTTRTTKLNDTLYDDPNAFSRIINMLGFPKGNGL